VRYAVIQLV